jgi:tetrapyrrole methylase family protein/MazG family protein
MLTVAGLGPGAPGAVPLEVLELLRSGRRVILRTTEHPVVPWLLEQGVTPESLDHLYEKASTFEEVYARMTEFVVGEATREDVVFAVPGHPLVAEEAVHRILATGIPVRLVPAMSFVEAIYVALRLDPMRGVFVLDALQLDKQQPHLAAGNVVAQVYNRLVAGETKLTLMQYYPDDHPVTVVRAACVPGEERIAEVPLYALDRVDWFDHLTSLYLPPLHQVTSGRYCLDPLVNVVAVLRGARGCPWDREQTHATLARYILEEAFETVEAIEQGKMYNLCEELGDLLLQIVLHAQLASEEGFFDIRDVIKRITAKMVHRHPHVFGGVEVRNSREVRLNWDRLKRAEKQEGGYLAGISKALPALLRAEKVQARAARVGFDWPDYRGPLAKVAEELKELERAVEGGASERVREEVGDLLFAVVNLARLLGVNAERACADSTERFIRRFAYLEQRAAAEGRPLEDLSLEEMDRLWEEAKQRENRG